MAGFSRFCGPSRSGRDGEEWQGRTVSYLTMRAPATSGSCVAAPPFPMLICQISDLHVRPPGELAYRRVDTAGFVRRCVAQILARRPLPDAVVVTGDLTDRGQLDEYRHLAELLAPLSMPFYLIAGNHDERGALRAVFSAH